MRCYFYQTVARITARAPADEEIEPYKARTVPSSADGEQAGRNTRPPRFGTSHNFGRLARFVIQ